MDSYPNFNMNNDFENYENNEYNPSLYLSPSQVPLTQNPQTSQNFEKKTLVTKWDADEDVALMSAWCLASEDSIHGKNRRKTSLWTEVKKIYDASRAENPDKFGERNVDQMKGRFSRLNENAGKWVAAYGEAHRRAKSGMSQKDIENDAHKIYEQGGKKFNDSRVFNEVMCNHPKWELGVPRGKTRSRPEHEVDDKESDGSTKRTRTSEEGDYNVNSNPNTPTSGDSSMHVQRPIGRDAAKKNKGKGKVSNEIIDELHAMRLSRDSQVDLMKKRLEFDQQKEQKKEEREIKKMQLLHLNTLLQKEHLSFEEEQMKRSLISKYYGN